LREVNITLPNGYGEDMTPDEAPDLNDVMVPTEEVHPDHREHAKQSKHLDDDELERRTQHERVIVDADQPDSDK